ncbi:MAG: DUF2273 domain-containing protein [Clostridiales bacterium]|nr:DUF2273 domain-containing protein [Clostridiales bacterium]
MDAAEFLLDLWRNHKGKIIGVTCGLVFALFVIRYGFFPALFICLCIAAGLYIGKKIDSKVNIRQSVEDLFRN